MGNKLRVGAGMGILEVMPKPVVSHTKMIKILEVFMARNKQSRGRGLASADQETRRRVSSAGGKASHGGGRPQGS